MKDVLSRFKLTSVIMTLFVLLSASFISGCSGDFARRADGTCVFVCDSGTGGGA